MNLCYIIQYKCPRLWAFYEANMQVRRARCLFHRLMASISRHLSLQNSGAKKYIYILAYYIEETPLRLLCVTDYNRYGFAVMFLQRNRYYIEFHAGCRQASSGLNTIS